VKTRTLIVLVVVAVILGGLATWSVHQRRSRVAAPPLAAKVLPDLDVNRAAKFVIHTPTATVTVARVNERWSVLERWNYPADFDKVSELLRGLLDLKVGQVVRVSPRQLPDLGLAVGGDQTNATEAATVVELFDEDGRTLAGLRLGKSSRAAASSRDMFGFGGYTAGRYVATDPEHVYLVADALDEVTPTPRDWLDDEFVSVMEADVVSVEVTGGTNPPVRLTQPPGGGPWVLDNMPTDKELDATKVSRLASALSYLRFEDVAATNLTPAETGLDQPVIFTARTRQGEIYTVRIGKAAEGELRRFVGISVAYEPPPEPATGTVSTAGSDTNQAAAAAAEREARQAAALKVARLNERLSPWVYLLSSYHTDAMLTPPAELLKDKPAPAAATTNHPPTAPQPPAAADSSPAASATDSPPAPPGTKAQASTTEATNHTENPP